MTNHAILPADQIWLVSKQLHRKQHQRNYCVPHSKMAEAFAKKQSKETDQRAPDYNQAVENSIRSPPLGYVVNSHHIKYDYRFREEIKIYDPLIDSLERALSKPMFCCGGSLRPSDMDSCVIQVKPTSSEAGQDNWREFALSDLPLDELLEYCNPAPFGDIKEMKTVLDPEVRLAYEIESARFKVHGSPGMMHIRAHIQDKLTPGRCVNLDPYKVNVYGERGFFKPHVDNPSDPKMIGTLVICLPSPHKGGELLVNHDGLQHVFDFSKHSGDTSRIQWAAFYSDCIHEVKPILEGHRVTTTYNIIASEWPPSYHEYTSRYTEPEDAVSLQEHFECSAESPSLTTKALANVKIELEKIQSKAKRSPSKVGFLLKHKYTTKGLQPHLLKGEDKGLHDYLVDKECKCELMSVLTRYQTDVVRPYGPEDDGELDESHEVYEFKPLKSTKPTASVYGSLDRRWLARANYRQWRVGIPFVEIYRKAENSSQIVRNNKGDDWWIGNQVEDVGVDKIYLDSAFIVEL